MLCDYSVRTGGFGPMQGNKLTTCFLDTILLPLPTWLFLAFGLPLLLFSSRPLSPPATSHSRALRAVTWLYYILTVALLAMDVLEIARLALPRAGGIGLLPFGLVGVLGALGAMRARARGWRKERVVGGVLVVYWALLLAFQAVKVDTLISVENAAKAMGSKGPTKYPNSDKSLDNYVILGLYVVLFLYELVRLVRKPRTVAHTEPTGMDEPMVMKNGARSRGSEV